MSRKRAINLFALAAVLLLLCGCGTISGVADDLDGLWDDTVNLVDSDKRELTGWVRVTNGTNPLPTGFDGVDVLFGNTKRGLMDTEHLSDVDLLSGNGQEFKVKYLWESGTEYTLFLSYLGNDGKPHSISQSYTPPGRVNLRLKPKVIEINLAGPDPVIGFEDDKGDDDTPPATP